MYSSSKKLGPSRTLVGLTLSHQLSWSAGHAGERHAHFSSINRMFSRRMHRTSRPKFSRSQRSSQQCSNLWIISLIRSCKEAGTSKKEQRKTTVGLLLDAATCGMLQSNISPLRDWFPGGKSLKIWVTWDTALFEASRGCRLPQAIRSSSALLSHSEWPRNRKPKQV